MPFCVFAPSRETCIASARRKRVRSNCSCCSPGQFPNVVYQSTRECMENLLRKAWPPVDWRDVTVLVAVSGGADSVGLLRGLHAIRSPGKGRLVVGHFNHELRDEADGDEAFVRELAAGLGLEFVAGRTNRPTGGPRPTTGLEESARQARYEFLRATAAEIGARYVATAHTADDQAETVL